MYGATLKSDTAGLPEEPCKLINPLRLLATDPPPPFTPPPSVRRPAASRRALMGLGRSLSPPAFNVGHDASGAVATCQGH